MTSPVNDGASLLVRFVDLCFAAARTEDGAFRFGREEPPWMCAETVDLEVALDELGRLLDEWREIQEVIPSLDCRVRLTEELGVRRHRPRPRALGAARRDRRPALGAGTGSEEQPAGPRHLPRARRAASMRVRSRSWRRRRRRYAADAPARRRRPPRCKPETPCGPGVESPHPGPVGGARTKMTRTRRSRRASTCGCSRACGTPSSDVAASSRRRISRAGERDRGLQPSARAADTPTRLHDPRHRTRRRWWLTGRHSALCSSTKDY